MRGRGRGGWAGCIAIAWVSVTLVPGADLVWHARGPGDVRESAGGGRPINPASVVKIATSLWALERLGPDHRFHTRFATNGRFDPSTGRIDGDLCVVGGADPDFHVENAWRVLETLARRGVRSVTGRLRVDDRFWIGWEGGIARRERDPSRRAAMMAGRLRDAFDPERWDEATRALWEDYARRGKRSARPPAGLRVEGAGRLDEGVDCPTRLATHVSNPLAATLTRLNAWSNNDIERLGTTLGVPEDLVRFLSSVSPPLAEGVRLASLSGLGSNRMTPAQAVELVLAFERTCERHGLDVASLLPVVGCDPGTLERFEALAARAPGAVVAKTGTLTRTDGGVAVLAGLAWTASGRIAFCVASPSNGGRVSSARQAHERWLLDRIASAGGAVARRCPRPVTFSDTDARVVGPGPGQP